MPAWVRSVEGGYQGNLMSNAHRKSRENPAHTAKLSVLFAVVLGFLIAFAPVLHGEPADQSDQPSVGAVLNSDQASMDHGGEPAGLSCHPEAGCSATAMLPGTAQARGTGRKQTHRGLGPPARITRQVAPDSKPPIA